MGEISSNAFCLVLFLGILIIFESCYTISYSVAKERGFSQCYNPKVNADNPKLSYNGYYQYKTTVLDSFTQIKGSRDYYLFFKKDGLVLQVATENQLRFLQKNDQWESKGLQNGIYEIIDDTLYIENLRIGSTTAGCALWKLKILNDKSLEILQYRNCDSPNEPLLYQNGVSRSLATFVESDTLPDFNEIWALKKKWFWCDEKDFKNWKLSQ